MDRGNSRPHLQREKLDFTELNPDEGGPYKAGALASHRRPYELRVAQRPRDNAEDRAATVVLDGFDDGGESSSSSE